jgi:nucleotide-binding universal stress UspA family protein
VFRRILACYDGSASSRCALKRTAPLAIMMQAQVHVLVVVPSGSLDPELLAGAFGTVCVVEDPHGIQGALKDSVEWLRARGVDVEVHVTRGNLIDEVVVYAKTLAIDLIVLAHYPQTSGGFWWTNQPHGSLSQRTNCCVLVAAELSA